MESNTFVIISISIPMNLGFTEEISLLGNRLITENAGCLREAPPSVGHRKGIV